MQMIEMDWWLCDGYFVVLFGKNEPLFSEPINNQIVHYSAKYENQTKLWHIPNFLGVLYELTMLRDE